MKSFLTVLIVMMPICALGQTADAIYQQACGPKDAAFEVQQVKGQPPATPEPGKALVYFVQKGFGAPFTTRIGVDGAWAGVILHDSYIFASVAPGEHHACAATLDRNHPKVEFVHFTVEAGKVYYYLVRGIVSTPDTTMIFGPDDRDNALYRIGSSQQSVSQPKK